MSGDERMADLDYSYAPLPHALTADMSISHGACRTWGIVHMLKWNHIDPDPPAIAELLGVVERSVYRWLQELEGAGWLTWNRHDVNPRRRLMLRTSRDGADAAKLAQVRALFANGAEPSIEAIRTLLEAPDPEDEGGKPPEDGPENSGGAAEIMLEKLRRSDSGVSRSDSGVTSDTGVTCDPGVTCDSRITCGDSGVSRSDSGIRFGDSTISPCDPGVIFDDHPALPDASNGIFREVGVGGSHVGSLDSKEPPTPRKRGRPKHALHRREKTALEDWLLDQDMLPDSARRFRHLDLEAAKAAFNEFMRDCPREDRFRRIGSLVEKWKERPPQPPQRVTRRFLPIEEARELAERLAPAPDASDDDRGWLAANLADGMPEAEALESMRNRQAVQRYRAERRQQVQP